MHKPAQSFYFGFIIFLTLGILCLVFPENGLSINKDVKLTFPTISSLLDEEPHNTEVSSIIEAINTIDSIANNEDTITAMALAEVLNESPVKSISNIHYKNKTALKNFFDALEQLKNNKGQVRILHYGDSQIEGDRMTEYLRSKYQSQFGGQGPGLMSLMPLTQRPGTKIITGQGWETYGVYMAKDKRVSHSNFGVLAGFNRFLPYRKTRDTCCAQTSSLSISASNTSSYKKVKLFYGGAKVKTWCEFYDGPALIGADSLNAGGHFNILEYEVGRGSTEHTFRFAGKDSPDFYAVSLEGDNGVLADNIALRGSSGTFFYQINNAQLKSFYDYLNVKLIILQFGGNALPAIKDEKMASNYGNYIKHQLSILKKIAPGASILFIGPSDMSIKNGTDYVTRPFLEETRDAIKNAVLESGCAFFDIYQSMGGKNSMPEWVEQKLAASDYIHFSPQGARKIATLLYAAMHQEYLSYQESVN
jgi:lysophospholipase L1-like esterase